MSNNEPQRKNLRLISYDYSSAGKYFITICAKDKKMLFGDIATDEIKLTSVGQSLKKCWLEIPKYFPQSKINEFIIMPNHLHGIIEINELGDNVVKTKLSSIVRGLKIGVTKNVGFSVWQRNYYEHVIRNEADYLRVVEYIKNNPLRWNKGLFNKAYW